MTGRYAAAREGVGALAVEHAGTPDALDVVARRLAIGQAVMTTRGIADELRRSGFSFDSPRKFETETRAWLVRNSCFVEHSRGNWTLGYHAADL
jgi:hypothetical protein